ncbi:MAG: DUF5610 domain-containing protein [Chitinivibrionia bacterium]|nr:DUF5610 domain-containing protein [Chitinivibrionia bacterium]
MVQGIGITNNPVDNYTNAANFQRRGNEVGNSDLTRRPARQDEAIISSEGNRVRENEEARRERHDEIARGARDEFQRLQANIIRAMLQAVRGEDVNTASFDAIFNIQIPESEQGMTAEEIIATLPDAWKPEAVAERIVDFAISFYERSGLSGEEFLEAVTNAINSGFAEADRQLNGRLPANIQQVIQFTRDAVSERLERWAESTGIRIPERVDLTV